MQSQPNLQNSAHGDSRRRRQAAATADDVFKGGAATHAAGPGNGLPHPWAFGAGRLWPAGSRQGRRAR